MEVHSVTGADEKLHDLLQDGIVRLQELAKSPHFIRKEDAQFEESFQKREYILSLPVENACWCIGDFEHMLIENGKVLRLMALQEISTPDNTFTLMTSIAVESEMSYEEQAVRLFFNACFHPLKKQPRRPFCVKLRDSEEGKHVILDVPSFGVKFFKSDYSISLVLDELHHASNLQFRRCFCCGLCGTTDMFKPCFNCDAVLYCDDKCKEESWNRRHRKWCAKFKMYMSMEGELARLPFSFSKATTSRDFNNEKLMAFLKENDVYNKGLWRRECSLCEDEHTTKPFGELESLDHPFGLPLEDAVLETSPPNKKVPSLYEPLTDWASYYEYRGFWLDSPITCLLHYPLTLYWIITSCLPKNCPEVFTKIKQSKCFYVHVIGAEKESEMILPFLECARLLFPATLHILFFGDELSKHVHRSEYKKENLMIQLHSCLYHLGNLDQLPQPDLVIAFNAGLSAYTTFQETIQLVLAKEIPFFCTDYCYYSIAHSKKALKKNKAGTMLKPIINPFRSPLRMVASELNLPRYSNAFVYHLIPYR